MVVLSGPSHEVTLMTSLLRNIQHNKLQNIDWELVKEFKAANIETTMDCLVPTIRGGEVVDPSHVKFRGIPSPSDPNAADPDPHPTFRIEDL